MRPGTAIVQLLVSWAAPTDGAPASTNWRTDDLRSPPPPCSSATLLTQSEPARRRASRRWGRASVNSEATGGKGALCGRSL